MIFCKHCVAFLLACSSFLLQPPELPAESYVLQSQWGSVEMTDKLIEDSFEIAAKNAGIKHPESARIQYHEQEVVFIISQEGKDSFITCHYHNKRPHCSALDESIAQLVTLDSVEEHEIPLDVVEDYSKKNTLGHRLKLMGMWAAVFLSGYYGIKKLLNKIVKGQCFLPASHHSHFFKTPDEMDHSLVNIKNLLKEIFPLIRKDAMDFDSLPETSLVKERFSEENSDSCRLILEKYQEAVSDGCDHDCHQEDHSSESDDCNHDCHQEDHSSESDDCNHGCHQEDHSSESDDCNHDCHQEDHSSESDDCNHGCHQKDHSSESDDCNHGCHQEDHSSESDDCNHGCHQAHHSSQEDHSAKNQNKFMFLASDFYQETFKRPLEFMKSTLEHKNRTQLIQFTELEAIKNYYEKGFILTVGGGIFIVSTQLVYESLESIVLPAGMHLFCTVGNTAIMSVAVSAYILYFHTRNIKEISFLPWKERMKVIFQILSLRLNTRGFQKKTPSMFDNLSSRDRFLFNLVLLEKSVELELRYALHTDKISKRASRRFAKRLGKLRKELELIHLHLTSNSHRFKSRNLVSWIDRLEKVHLEIVREVEKKEEIME